MQLIATLEAGVDFAEDDVEVLPWAQILERLGEIRTPLLHLAESFAYGKVVHEGMTLAIAGPPNVGKSSIFNRLVERDRAIVTATPGTTRDWVTETVSLGGIPLKLIDTAGIRTAVDEAEGMGIRKSYEALAEADLVLVVMEAGAVHEGEGWVERLAGEPFAGERGELAKALEGRKRILVGNKVDLLPGARQSRRNGDEMPMLYTSAVTGEGIEELRERILSYLCGEGGVESETGFLTNVRQHSLVREGLNGLEAARKAVEEKIPHEMLLMDLYSGLRPLDGITGQTTTEDVLHRIFSSFCIGK